jgi:hypothetical protein
MTANRPPNKLSPLPFQKKKETRKPIIYKSYMMYDIEF